MISVTMPIEEYERLKRLEANDPFDPRGGMMGGRTYGDWKQSEIALKARVQELESHISRAFGLANVPDMAEFDASVQACAKDLHRLNYLQSSGPPECLWQFEDGMLCYHMDHIGFTTIREAIDNAMQVTT